MPACRKCGAKLAVAKLARDSRTRRNSAAIHASVRTVACGATIATCALDRGRRHPRATRVRLQSRSGAGQPARFRAIVMIPAEGFSPRLPSTPRSDRYIGIVSAWRPPAAFARGTSGSGKVLSPRPPRSESACQNLLCLAPFAYFARDLSESGKVFSPRPPSTPRSESEYRNLLCLARFGFARDPPESGRSLAKTAKYAVTEK